MFAATWSWVGGHQGGLVGDGILHGLIGFAGEQEQRITEPFDAAFGEPLGVYPEGRDVQGDELGGRVVSVVPHAVGELLAALEQLPDRLVVWSPHLPPRDLAFMSLALLLTSVFPR